MLIFLFVLISTISLAQNGKKTFNYISVERAKYPTHEKLVYALLNDTKFGLDRNFMYDFAKKIARILLASEAIRFYDCGSFNRGVQGIRRGHSNV